MVYNVVEDQSGNNTCIINGQLTEEGATQYPSVFRGEAFEDFFRSLLVLIVSIVTLGLAYPAIKCWYLRWEISNTYINSRKLSFDGNAKQLYGNYINWFLLCIVTLGVYAVFFMPLNMERWITKHTHFEGLSGESKFDGSILGLFGVTLVSRLIVIFTLGIGISWAMCYKQRWLQAHRIVDGHGFYFEGSGAQLIWKIILWLFLSLITLGIFGIWMANRLKKWNIAHTFVQEPHALAVNPVPLEKMESLTTTFNAVGVLLMVIFSPLMIPLAILAIFGLVDSN